jgi:hypothetical protein
MPYYGWKRPQFKRDVHSPPVKRGFVQAIGKHSTLPPDHPVSKILEGAGMGVRP